MIKLVKNFIGYLLVADVSQNPDEPDISTCEDAIIPELDRFLESEARSLMASDGREMVFIVPLTSGNWARRDLREGRETSRGENC